MRFTDESKHRTPSTITGGIAKMISSCIPGSARREQRHGDEDHGAARSFLSSPWTWGSILAAVGLAASSKDKDHEGTMHKVQRYGRDLGHYGREIGEHGLSLGQRLTSQIGRNIPRDIPAAISKNLPRNLPHNIRDISQNVGRSVVSHLPRSVLPPQKSGMGATSTVSSILLAAGLGAGLMYLFDPARGRRRRSLLRDQVVHAANVTGTNVRKAARDASQRTRGLAYETAARFRDEDITDEQLIARVRSALGRACSHPGAIHVGAHGRIVTLAGPILEHEVAALLATVAAVRGVKDIEDRLEPHETPDIPSLQGGIPRNRRAMQGWNPPTRIAVGVAGGSLLTLAAVRRDLLGLALGLAGTGLLFRSASNISTRRLVGIGAGHRAVDVQKTLTINSPVDRVFEFFTRYENFPHFMRNVQEVRELGGDRSHWVVSGPGGIPVQWDADVTRFEPGKVLAWKSVEGSPIRNAGVIRFEESPDGEGTRVNIRLSYNPPGGALGHMAAKLFGADPKSEMDDDLMRLKIMIETGRPPHDAAQPIHEGHDVSPSPQTYGGGTNQGGGDADSGDESRPI